MFCKKIQSNELHVQETGESSGKRRDNVRIPEYLAGDSDNIRPPVSCCVEAHSFSVS